MALSSTILDADAAYIVKQDLPVTVTVGASLYTGTRMSVRQARESAAEGQRNKYAFSVYLLISDFATLPAVDSLVSIGGVEYLITSKDTDDAQDILRIDLAEKFSGGV
jgi:hypothetical protein